MATLVAAALALATIAAHEQPRSGGTLTWIINPIPSSLVPLTTTAGGNTEIGPKVMEDLLAYEWELKPRPQLATPWNIRADGLQCTFKLRPGVKWHGGRDFSSADVAFSILTLKQVRPRSRGTFANVVEVKSPDPLTAVVVLSKASPFLLTALAAAESPIVPNQHAAAYASKNGRTNVQAGNDTPLHAAHIGRRPPRLRSLEDERSRVQGWVGARFGAGQRGLNAAPSVHRRCPAFNTNEAGAAAQVA